MGEAEYQIENIEYDRVCVVCGKPVKFEQASVHLKVEEGQMIDLLPVVPRRLSKKARFLPGSESAPGSAERIDSARQHSD